MLDIFLIREIAALAGTTIAAYTDIKTGLIYDYITYPMIALGLALNLFEQQYDGLLYAGIVFAAGFALYYTGKLGGGDVKLYTALTMLLPKVNGSIFILNVLIYSGLAALVFVSTYYTLKYLKKTGSLKAAIEENKSSFPRTAALLAAILLYFYFIVTAEIVSISYAYIVAVPMLFGIVFVAFEKGIREKIFLEWIDAGKLEEDEIIAREHMGQKDLEGLNLGAKGVLEKQDIEKIKKLGIKIPVYRNLPKFAPFILLGLAIALFSPGFPALFW